MIIYICLVKLFPLGWFGPVIILFLSLDVWNIVGKKSERHNNIEYSVGGSLKE